MKHIVYQCPRCKRYLMDDSEWERPRINDFALMLLHKKDIELKETLCPNCDTEGSRR